ncbi:hypothetical protein C7974DRAFT_456737 [Boeremia exigua]|uniref:uncharacterized protein n=1 Tax=Boeremia exigua TaxID=749465 RepID=UPI001E8E69EA|nr:uncharacterized protein C7974DRAFT_456737 [Boeremia exigua]KAH6621944.1 hypothetical protein C7974DRAFT_456737 [Boeremia exigua]
MRTAASAGRGSCQNKARPAICVRHCVNLQDRKQCTVWQPMIGAAARRLPLALHDAAAPPLAASPRLLCRHTARLARPARPPSALCAPACCCSLPTALAARTTAGRRTQTLTPHTDQPRMPALLSHAASGRAPSGSAPRRRPSQPAVPSSAPFNGLPAGAVSGAPQHVQAPSALAPPSSSTSAVQLRVSAPPPPLPGASPSRPVQRPASPARAPAARGLSVVGTPANAD